MRRIDKKQLAGHFGRRVRSYDAATPVQAHMASRLVDRARSHFAGQEVTRILELGCGTGRMTRQLASAFPQARITALDLAPEMIAHARSALADVDFVVADAEVHLQLDSGEYDLIVSNAAAQWFDDADTALARARGRLASGGLLAVATFGDQTFRELRHAFALAYASIALPEVAHVVAMRSVVDWQRGCPDAEIAEQVTAKVFPDVVAFLRSVQQAGAVNSLAGVHYLSRSVLREMVRSYTANYATPARDGVTATYHTLQLYSAARSIRR